MRAYYIVSTADGTRLDLRDVPLPEPKGGELLIRVKASALNRGELIKGHGVVLAPGETDAKPCGTEAAGEIASVGAGVEGWSPGTRVMGRCKGGFADYAVMDAREAMRIPDTVGWEEAASVPIVFLVTYDMLVEQGALAPGEWVLVAGVSSGVGVASLQTAQAMGARVIGTSTAPAKLERLRAAGLEHALPGDPGGLVTSVREITGGRGADLVVDAVGGSVFPACIEALAYKGRLAMVGYVDGVLHADLDLQALHSKRLRLYGVSNKFRTAAERAATVAGFVRDVLPLLASGRIRPLIDAVYAFDDLPAAKARMEANVHVGKIVVRL